MQKAETFPPEDSNDNCHSKQCTLTAGWESKLKNRRVRGRYCVAHDVWNFNFKRFVKVGSWEVLYTPFGISTAAFIVMISMFAEWNLPLLKHIVSVAEKDQKREKKEEHSTKIKACLKSFLMGVYGGM